jgi:hypothetical protein
VFEGYSLSMFVSILLRISVGRSGSGVRRLGVEARWGRLSWDVLSLLAEFTSPRPVLSLFFF